MQENQFDYHNTIFAGDSGNDVDVMLSPIQSILVANAHPDVKEQVMASLNQQQKQNSVYLARGGFRHMNGNYSAGILEGIQYYVPEIVDRLEKI
jgi:virulence-associated protein VapD